MFGLFKKQKEDCQKAVQTIDKPVPIDAPKPVVVLDEEISKKLTELKMSLIGVISEHNEFMHPTVDIGKAAEEILKALPTALKSSLQGGYSSVLLNENDLPITIPKSYPNSWSLSSVNPDAKRIFKCISPDLAKELAKFGLNFKTSTNSEWITIDVEQLSVWCNYNKLVSLK